MSETFRNFSGKIPEIFRTYMESFINHTFVMNDVIYAASLLSCYCEEIECSLVLHM